MEIDKEYVVGYTKDRNPIIFKKNSLEEIHDRYSLSWNKELYTYYAYSVKFDLIYFANNHLNLGLTQDQLNQMEKMEEDEFLRSLEEACKKINSELWYQIPTEDDSKKKICNLCKHYSLLNQFCEKDRLPKKKDDTCTHWEE